MFPFCWETEECDVLGKRKELIVDACLVCGCCWNDRFGHLLVVISVPFVTNSLV